MLAFTIIAASLAVFVLASRKSLFPSSGVQGESEEQKALNELRSQLAKDLNDYYAAAPDGGLKRFTGDVFNRTPLSTVTPSDKEIQQLSNATEWAAKCVRNSSGICAQQPVKGNQMVMSDDAIIEGSQRFLPALIAHRYPNASAEQMATIYIRVVKETTVDVKNLHWMKVVNIVTLVLAPLTAGLSVAGAIARLTAMGAINAGVNVFSGAIGVAGVFKTPKDEKEAKIQLTEMYAIIKNALNGYTLPISAQCATASASHGSCK